jgi:hypothetical protein
MIDTSANSSPAVVHVAWVLLGGLFVSPLLAASFAAYNHARHRSWVAAFGALALAIAASIATGTAVAALPPTLAYGAVLLFHFGAVGALVGEQIAFRRKLSVARHVHWAAPALIAALSWLLVRALPGVVWIFTGDPALRPF